MCGTLIARLFLIHSVLILINSVSATEERREICPLIRGECKSRVILLNNETRVQLEVTCICPFERSRDVSGNLTLISEGIKCRYLPSNEADTPLWLSTLVLNDCDVSKKTFPSKLLRIMRRSENFSIYVTGAKIFRLEKDEKTEKVSPSINATFFDSILSGFPKGLFTGAKEVLLNVSQSKVGIISAESFHFDQDSNVDLRFTASEIDTVKANAFTLPPNGSLTIEGGELVQLEKKAYKGGSSLSLEGVKISNIQSNGINLYGLDQFKMEACYVANLQEYFLYEKEFDIKENTKTGVEEIAIIDNVIAQTHPDAFAGLCREENLKFHNNYLGIIGGPITLRLKKCEKERDWINSTMNTGLKCEDCDALLSSLDEQICAVYRSSWCIKCLRSDPSKTQISSTESFDSECKTHFYDFVWATCSYALSGQYEKTCTEKLGGKSLFVISGGVAKKYNGNLLILARCFAIFYILNKISVFSL